MKTIVLIFAAFALCTISCKKENRGASLPVKEALYKSSGNNTPTPSELLTIRGNLEKLSKLNSQEQKDFISTFKPFSGSQESSTNNPNSLLTKQSATADEEQDYANWINTFQSPTDDINAPDESAPSMLTPAGFEFLYKWTVAYNTLGFFKIASLERCELLNYGRDRDPQYQWESIIYIMLVALSLD